MIEVVNGSIDRVAAEVLRNPGLVHEDATWRAIYDVEQWRKGSLIHQERNHNLITLEGKRYILDIAMKGNVGNTYNFHTAWYVCLSSTNTTPNATTMLYTAKQFTEFTNFKAPTTARQAWVGTLDVSAATHTNNLSKAAFTIGANPLTAVYGAGLVTLNTLGDSSSGDYLLSYSAFSSSVTVTEDDVIKVGITITLS